MKKFVVLVLLLAALSINAHAEDLALWQWLDYPLGTISQAQDSIAGLTAQVITRGSNPTAQVNKNTCCGSIIIPNAFSDADSTNIMLKVEDSDILTGHDNGNAGFSSLTIEIEFMPYLLKQAQIVRKTEASTNVGYQVYMTEEGKVGFSLAGDLGDGGVVSRNIAETGKWHKIIATWENRFENYNTQIILDGIVSRATTTIGTLTDTTYPLTIGGLYRSATNFGQFFSGEIRKILISTDRPRLLDIRGACDPLETIIPTGSHLENQPGYISSEFIYEIPKHPECHASSITDLGNGQLAAVWNGGTCEGHIDFFAWYSRYDGTAWSEPVILARGPMHFPDKDTIVNPVIFKHSSGKVLFFYKIGTLTDGITGRMRVSEDNGQTFGAVINLPAGIMGPSKNKPIELSNGDILCPSTSRQMEITSDFGTTWQTRTVPNNAAYEGVIQPTVLQYPGGKLQAIFRTQEDNLAQSLSFDEGNSWSSLNLTSLPSNNSGIDAATLDDGCHLIVYNHSSIPSGNWGGPRTPLNLALTTNGTTWYAALVLEDEPGEYSYPALIQSDDGLVHIVYTWHRLRIKHVTIDPDQLVLQQIVTGQWP